MDEHRERQPAPTSLIELPDHVRKWLNGLEPEDIDRYRRWGDFIVWFETSGRYARNSALFLMGLFGLYTSLMFVWDKWWRKG